MPTVDYRVNNKKIPSVTTVLSRYKNATGLIIWANKLGLDGQSYHDELKKAADIGTALHDLAEIHIKGEFYELPKDEKVRNCFNQFLEWWENFKQPIIKNQIEYFKLLWTEKHFCSEKYLYGGTPDLLVKKKWIKRID